MSHHLTPLWTARLKYPPEQTSGPFADTAAGNYARAGAPATGPWGHSMRLGIMIGRFYERIQPLLYPQGEKDLLGRVATQALAPPALVSPVWPYYGTQPLAGQPFGGTPAPWTLQPRVSGSTSGKPL